MSKRFNTRAFGLSLAESAIIFGALLLSLYLRVGIEGADYELNERGAWMKILIATCVCLVSLYIYDLYSFAVMNDRRELIFRLLQALGTAWAALAILFYFAPDLIIGRGVTILSVPLVISLLLGWRLLIHWLTAHPDIGERVLIVGSGQAAIDTAKATKAQKAAGYRVVGFLSSEPELLGKSLFNPKVIGLIDDLEDIVKREKIDRVVIAIRDRRGAFPTDQLLRLSLSGDVAIEEVTSFHERLTGQLHLDMLRPSWLIFAGRSRATKLRWLVRETVHRGLALIGLVLSLPIAILTAVLIKLESAGPVFYRQERVGKNGRTFQVIKFRSMRADAEKDGIPIWAQDNDSRVTRIGKIIRLIRVDEIPQFWCILKGEMSFVGPRPERPHFVSQLAE
ncbi:MAG TPA: exopolysaccharide biosynthesis polyprenyl glycosylphosphotransferase, partial [Pyrinomonadaceae bacterium]|nr:exopolysaccharide biosynthesis polyprenyl glycosylphosphotransferase [Pyrinomonadaceae bacterium]